MACFHPLKAYKSVSGTIHFKNPGSSIHLELPCGRCIGCRIAQSQEWAVRCMHETQLHEANCAVTLTYDEEKVQRTLTHKDFQLFMKKVRMYFDTPVRYFMCGEYGDLRGRAHFHSMLFGIAFYEDRKYFKLSDSGQKLYDSPTLDKLWGNGHALIQDADYQMAAYIARYCTKKIGKDTDQLRLPYEDVFDPYTGEIFSRRKEYARMSTKPGIGCRWMNRFSTDITNTDTLIYNGMEQKIPRYYKKWLEDNKPEEYQKLKKAERARAEQYKDDSTVERLQTRERVLTSRQQHKVRNHD